MKIIIIRKKTSYQYKHSPESPSSYDNNCRNNEQDRLMLVDGDAVIFDCPCQSVHNLDWGKDACEGKLPYGDTLAPGEFSVRLFCDPRNYRPTVHEIINAKNIEGEQIDRNAMKLGNGHWSGRWLIHSKYSPKSGRDTRFAWSAGCIILSSANFEILNTWLLKKGLKRHDVIKGVIKEE